MAYVDIAVWGPYKIATVISREQILRGTITNAKYFNGKEWVTTIPSVYIGEEMLGLKCTVKNTSLYNQKVNARCIFTFSLANWGYWQLGWTTIKQLAVNATWEFWETLLPNAIGDWEGRINLQMEPV